MNLFLHTVWAIYQKELALWRHNPGILVATIISPVFLLGIGAVLQTATGRSPVALVTLDAGPLGLQVHQIFHDADVFRITDASPAQAQALLDKLDVTSVITIPVDFTQLIQAHDNSPIDLT